MTSSAFGVRSMLYLLGTLGLIRTRVHVPTPEGVSSLLDSNVLLLNEDGNSGTLEADPRAHGHERRDDEGRDDLVLTVLVLKRDLDLHSDLEHHFSCVLGLIRPAIN